MQFSQACVLLAGYIGFLATPGLADSRLKKSTDLGPTLRVGQFKQAASKKAPTQQSGSSVAEHRRSPQSSLASGPASNRAQDLLGTPPTQEPVGWDQQYSLPPLSEEKHLSVGQEYDDPLYVGYQVAHGLEQEYGPYLSLVMVAGIGAVREATQDSTLKTDVVGALLGTFGRRLFPERDTGPNLSIRSTPIGTAFGLSFKFR
jgi:hypothetical protein